MTTFKYEFKHSNGSGAGFIEAENEDDAKAEIRAYVEKTQSEDGKLKRYKIEIGERVIESDEQPKKKGEK